MPISQEFLTVYFKSNGWSSAVDFPKAIPEALDIVDITDLTAWTPYKVNNMQVRIKSSYAEPTGGCLHPDLELMRSLNDMDDCDRAENFKTGDQLLGYENGRFKPANITKFEVHEGRFTFCNFITHYRMANWDADLRSKLLARIHFGEGIEEISENELGYKDLCVTENHPLNVVRRDRGIEPLLKRAGDIKIGESLWGLFIKDGELGIAPCPIIEIQRFEGSKAINIETDVTFMFGHVGMLYYLKW